MTADNRPGWDQWAMTVAFAVATRGDCTRRQVGAVILDSQHRVIATGYNGVRPGRPGCLAGACPRGTQSYDKIPGYSDYDSPGPGYCIATHAEMNAILSAAPFSLQDGTLYVTIKPCDWCMKQIVNTRLYRAVWLSGGLGPEDLKLESKLL